jgi:hypothetical protein
MAETGELPSMITDQLKLKQIVTNLSITRSSFTEEGSVTVSAGIAPTKVESKSMSPIQAGNARRTAAIYL